jgi:phosphatidyl-myo-inositol alpha-mannosyltransferase
VSRVTLSIYDHVGNPHYGGGGALVVARIARELAVEHSVTVFCGSYRGARPGVVDGVRYRFLPVGWAGPRAGQLLFGLLLPLVALVHRSDLWIESLTPPVSASLLPLTARRPVVGLVQMLCGADMQRRYGLPFEAIERRGLRLYRHFVVLNDVDGALVGDANPRAAVVVIPNGVDVPDEEPADDAKDDAGPILFLGRIDVRQKGLDLLLAAVADEPTLRLDIAGSGTAAEIKRLHELVPPSAADRIRLLGRVDGERKTDLLRTCRFVVIPSRYETFSITALEALSYGKPVVHFAIDRHSWIGPGAGVAVPAFDVAALRTAMRALSDDGPRRAALGRGARARALDHTWTTVIGRYRDLVAALLAAPPSRPQRRNRFRSADRRSRASSGSRDTTSDRAHAAAATDPRNIGPVRPGNNSMRTCSRVPLARSALYDSLSPNRSSSRSSGSAKA